MLSHTAWWSVGLANACQMAVGVLWPISPRMGRQSNASMGSANHEMRAEWCIIGVPFVVLPVL